MSEAIEQRLSQIPSHEKAGEPKKFNIPIPIALAFAVFDTVVGSCAAASNSLRRLQNPEAADVLDSIAEELQTRAKAMLIESQRRVQLATELPR